MTQFNPVIDQCESGHHFAKLDDHPLQSDGKTPRCPHCMAIRLTKAREELTIAVNDRDSCEAHLAMLRSEIPKTLRQYRHNDDNSSSLLEPQQGFTFGYCAKDVDRLLARKANNTGNYMQRVKAQAIRQAALDNRESMMPEGAKWFCRVEDLIKYADKMEAQ